MSQDPGFFAVLRHCVSRSVLCARAGLSSWLSSDGPDIEYDDVRADDSGSCIYDTFSNMQALYRDPRVSRNLQPAVLEFGKRGARVCASVSECPRIQALREATGRFYLDKCHCVVVKLSSLSVAHQFAQLDSRLCHLAMPESMIFVRDQSSSAWRYRCSPVCLDTCSAINRSIAPSIRSPNGSPGHAIECASNSRALASFPIVPK